jgi:sulfite reductase (NADPH) flavoprotein alpha-component
LAPVDRDGGVQRRKTYVQHRLTEQARDVFAWIENGAHLYVCGSLAMGKDVHTTLRESLMKLRRVSTDQAEEFLSELQREGRYARDVY